MSCANGSVCVRINESTRKSICIVYTHAANLYYATPNDICVSHGKMRLFDNMCCCWWTQQQILEPLVDFFYYSFFWLTVAASTDGDASVLVVIVVDNNFWLFLFRSHLFCFVWAVVRLFDGRHCCWQITFLHLCAYAIIKINTYTGGYLKNGANWIFGNPLEELVS